MTIDDILDCLEKAKTRATYGAVGQALGMHQRSVRAELVDWNRRHGLTPEHRGPKTSWVVYKSSGEPAGYTDNQKHPDLYRYSRIIQTGDDLVRVCGRMSRS